ncbi:putative NTE family protein [termite gut metagenome]|uniref:Putative NTE family protein n=1 Tax=termite gut metagenome TaxID=433724 RepID=A0A5J4QYA3_9ZZZZ
MHYGLFGINFIHLSLNLRLSILYGQVFMKKVLLLSFLCLCIFSTSQAQSVGLVLSGGGAKGLTHIGVIRALEKNNIPIDYIAGTSIGAIVASLYAMGYTPDEMKALIGSDSFKLWYSGEVEGEYVYYFRNNPSTPELFNFSFFLKESSKMKKPQLFPESVVNPIQMNLVFLEIYAGVTAACGGNFDKLFVPFRCVASDIYHKKSIVMREGSVGDAVRASMSFPFMFKPIRINGMLAYDGGLYDNFPSDVMINDFKPDIIIGSVVADKRVEAQEHDWMGQLNNMIMDRSEYTLPDSLGILMTFDYYGNVGLFDFQKIDELCERGYNDTMNMMDTIKKRISRRTDADSIRLQREAFRNSCPELRFKNIYIQGAGHYQQEYIKKEFREDTGDEFGYEDLKRSYFRLLSGNAFSEIIPQAKYNPIEGSYDLYLDVKMKDELSIHIGGNVSTTNSNQIYMGASYQDLYYYSKEFILDGQIGKVYNNFQLMTRFDFNSEIPKSLRFIASLSAFDYFKEEKLFGQNTNSAFVKKKEDFAKLKLAMPFLQSRKAEFGIAYGKLKDRYFQSNVIDFETDKYDVSNYLLLGGSISFNGSTLNSRRHATRGYSEMLIAQIFTGKENFRSGLNLSENKEPYEKEHTWLQLSYERESYHKITPKYTFGWNIKALYASKNFSENYTATLLQAGEFAPTPHSTIIYNEAFRANQFIAGGIKPIYHLTDRLHARGEIYGFLPIFPIERNAINKAYYGKAFSRFKYMGEASLVYQMSFGSVSAYVNHYSSPKEWNMGVTLGWMLFNDRLVE